MKPDRLEKIAERFNAEVAEHEQPVEIPAVLTAQAQVILDLLDGGGQIGHQLYCASMPSRTVSNVNGSTTRIVHSGLFFR